MLLVSLRVARGDTMTRDPAVAAERVERCSMTGRGGLLEGGSVVGQSLCTPGGATRLFLIHFYHVVILHLKLFRRFIVVNAATIKEES